MAKLFEVGGLQRLSSHVSSLDKISERKRYFDAVKPSLAPLSIAILALVLRVPFLKVAMHVDEGGYAYTAFWWSKGMSLYNQLWFDRPQGIFVIYRLIFDFIGTDVLAIRIGAALAGLAATLLVYLIARRCFDRQIAIAAGAVFAVLSACPQTEGFSGNAETFMIVPAIGAVYLFVLGREKGGKIWFVAAGFATGLAVLIKPSELSTLLLLVVLAWTWFAGNKFRSLVLISIGFGLGILPSVIHGYLTGWNNYIFCVIGYRLLKDSVATRSVFLHAERFYSGMQDIVPGLALPMMVAMWAAVREYRAKKLRTIWLPVLWMASSFIGIAMGGNWYRHYFLQMVAPLSVLSAYGFIVLFRSIPRPMRYKFIAATAVVVIMATYVSFDVLRITDQRILSTQLFGFEQYQHDKDIADYIKSHTQPDDSVFVMYMGPEIVYQSERRSAFGNLYDKEYDRIPSIGTRLQQVLTDPLARPRYIVDLHSYPDHGDLHRNTLNIIRRDYVLEKSFGLSSVYRLKDQTGY